MWSTWPSEQWLTRKTSRAYTQSTSHVDWSLYIPLNIQKWHKGGKQQLHRITWNNLYIKELLLPSYAMFLYLQVLFQFGAVPHHFSLYSIRVWIWMWVILHLSVCVRAVMDWQSALALSRASNLVPQSVFLPLHSKNVNINPRQFWQRGNTLQAKSFRWHIYVLVQS